MSGLFIVFEGIDGSGSSTQAALLHQHMVASGVPAHLTSEPSSGPIGHLIREILTRRVFVSDCPETVDKELLYLFAADRFDHLNNSSDGILKRIEDGYMAISTRYCLSSFAYNVNTADDLTLARLLNENFPIPDLTFYLDCPPTVALARIGAEGRGPDRYENLAKLERVQKNYENAIAGYPADVCRLDATLTPESIHEIALARVRESTSEAG